MLCFCAVDIMCKTTLLVKNARLCSNMMPPSFILSCLTKPDKFRMIMQELEKSKPVILTGDLNCAHQEIDIHDPAVSSR